MLLEVDALFAGYGDAVILSGISLAVPKHSITAVIGSNGAGKTTLMRSLAGLLPARNGRIRFNGEDITTTKPAARVALGLSLVPEGRLVFPEMSVQDTLRIGAYNPGARGNWEARREEIYDLFPRLKERRHQAAGSLSGGEQQMLALGRGLMAAPKLLLLDEPSLGLAPIMADLVFQAIRAIRDTGITICIVEQDVHAALEIADHGYVVEHGHIAQSADCATLLASPEIREQIIGL